MSSAEPSAEQVLRRSLAIRIGVALIALVAVAVLAVTLSSGPQTPGDAAPAAVATGETAKPSPTPQPPLAVLAQSAGEPAKDQAQVSAAPASGVETPAVGQPAVSQAGEQTALPPAANKPAPASAEGDGAAAAANAGADASGKDRGTDPAKTQAKPGGSEDPAPTALRSAPGAKPPRGPHLQAGMFMQAANAQAFKAKLEARGLPVYIESRVHIGPFRDRREAERVRDELLERGVTTVLVAQ